MLKLISYKDISTHSDLFFNQFQLRHREFIERQSYAVKSIDGMEFDEYDSLAAQYLVFTEDGRTVLGCSRLTPIDLGCMLADHFPDLVEDKSIFTAPRVWEGTRFCIDSRLPSERRRLICQSLAVGYIEFGLAHGVDQIIGLMPTLILRSVFERAGLTLDRLGSPRAIGAHARIQAAAIPIRPWQRDRVYEATGLRDLLTANFRSVEEHVA
ncbi:acyl-homoserine-lactone synthase [Asticcacaulis sp. DXS10W]|uniref:Acyl-homoserine-lactone synthase n=1 Tax=Asticcacaulis currens TaxID=2984210 RepID=A0ABT5IBG6_9CAUL|nr:acyl-homoserine-lactone synthase [Asticcacaulis currens]MDC7693529.1 acyl-homoserine-lactone synthase [Asticcacaulis currens]